MSLPDSLTGKPGPGRGAPAPPGRGGARGGGGAGRGGGGGARRAARAASTAAELAAATGGDVTGVENAGAASAGDLVVVAVPWEGHGELVAGLAAQLAGKVVVDCVNPLGFDKQGAFALAVEEGSAAQQAQGLLPDSTVVGAFHNLSAVKLEDPEVTSVDTDVLVLGDVREATDLVQDLCGTIPGVRGVYGGRLRNAHQVEALTANLISVNRRYRAHAGVRITDL